MSENYCSTHCDEHRKETSLVHKRADALRAENAALAAKVKDYKGKARYDDLETDRLNAMLLAAAERERVLREQMDRLLREVGLTLSQWREEVNAGRPGVVYGSRMGQLAEAAEAALTTPKL